MTKRNWFYKDKTRPHRSRCYAKLYL